MLVNKYEKIDDLLIDGLKIIQDTRGFMYGTDAVLLTDFANIKANGRVLDLCTGSGIIPILLSKKSKAKEFVGVEYFKEISDMAIRSVKLNNLDEIISVINDDIKNYKNILNHHSFDNVTINPPYKNINSGATNLNDFKKAARHEILCTLDDCVKAAEYALKYKGRLTMVHRTDRMSDVFYTLKKYNIEPKRFKLVLSKLALPPKLFLIEGQKGANPGLKVEVPIILDAED